MIEIIKSLLNLQKKVDLKTLPSQGYFYKDDFELYIKKADMEDIIEYEYNYVKDNLLMHLYKVKLVVEKNTNLKNGYSFLDIRAIDIVYLFFEIVKFTIGKPIRVNYFDDSEGRLDLLEFGKDTFNYYNFEPHLKYWDKDSKEFIIDGYKYCLPTIGVENSITNFLLFKNDSNQQEYGKYSYDFTYFLGHKTHLRFDEVENLIQIFNFDIEDSEINKLKDVIKMLSPVQKYSLKKGNRIIDIASKIDLETIWK